MIIPNYGEVNTAFCTENTNYRFLKASAPEENASGVTLLITLKAHIDNVQIIYDIGKYRYEYSRMRKNAYQNVTVSKISGIRTHLKARDFAF